MGWNFQMIDWIPVVFVTFKVSIFALCMFFAIKWHYDQGKKKGADSRTLILTSAKVVGAFILALVTILLLTFFLASRLGMDLSL